MLLALPLFFFIVSTLCQNPLGLAYLDKKCYKLKNGMVWFEVDISPKYQRNCQPLHHWVPIAGKDTFDESRSWYQGKTCLRDTESCCLTCRQYCTDNFRVKTTDSIADMNNLETMEISSTEKARDYLYVAPNIGNLNYVSVDLRQGLRSIIVPMDNLHPDDRNYRQVFQIKMTESIVTKILNNTKLYNKDAQTIQSDDHALGIDKICLLANDVLQTAAMPHDFSNCFRLIPNSETKSSCGYWGTSYEKDRGYFCGSSKWSNEAATLASCLENLPLINASKMAYSNKALKYMRTAVTSGISAIPYAGLVLAATTNAILGPTADEAILNEYKGAKYDEKLVILSGVRKQVLKESRDLAKGFIKDNFGDIAASIKKLM
ncbi:hypothetical protein K502DRAFT_351865 [Neoconidiobolus thromboides FSU 785]|nr:hypothetical protein K502DRAFT_351865 [Neoconidiobolus thromboides FSU 785]